MRHSIENWVTFGFIPIASVFVIAGCASSPKRPAVTRQPAIWVEGHLVADDTSQRWIRSVASSQPLVCIEGHWEGSGSNRHWVATHWEKAKLPPRPATTLTQPSFSTQTK